MMVRPGPLSKPSKRTRAEVDEPDLTSCHSPSPSTQVKDERSPSPTQKRLVTSGTKRFTPELEALNLVPERKLFRDDGLVIDWRSHVPVWSDTLKPDPQDLAAIIMLTHRSNAQWHQSATTSTQECPTVPPPSSGDTPNPEPPSKKRLPAPPRPSSRRRNNPSQLIPVDAPPSGPGSSSPCPKKPRLSRESERESHSPSRDRVSSASDRVPLLPDISSQHSQTGLPSRPASRACDQSIAPDPPSAAEEEMSEMTLDYLRRYVQTYESDRASLASAYASNASFAYRVHHIIQNISERSSSYLEEAINARESRTTASGSKRTRLDIATTLLTPPSLHVNAQSSSVAQIEYDMFYLGAKLGMLLVCRVVDSTKTVVHNFILQRKEADVEDAAIEGVWPLTAAAHQILVFQT
ncbi:hypothetical protein JVT61DRAFT_6595 [Boletus reticuloceps]|uniref:Nuclear transport factor 2 domain-containing protein n=1 Tax=Boletus reticuloceps TaxID=495285 RepID=A0A8I2YKN2_9AGAM|nr:hypothetical protein JVT61DRAFT_6595 [Boletus reticuloceps]